MAEKRKDSRGRNLRTGEYYDSKNKRYMFRKMIDGERVTITAADLVELRAQENELLYRIDKGNKLNTRNSRMPLNTYFDFWLETFAKSGRKATTCINYKSYYNTYIRDTIGKKERTAIEQRQIEIFMEYVRCSKQYSFSYPAFVVLFNLGLRIGEMAALTRDDVNFQDDIIIINKTVNRYRKADYGFTMGIASPKSKTSNRTIVMNRTIKTTLMKLKMQACQSSAKLPYVDDSGHTRDYVSGFIFLNSIGNVWNEPSFRELIKRIVEHLNREAEINGTEQIENFCPHMARHTYTSIAYSAGIDVKIVSQILGHASASVTMDVYTHLTEKA